MPNGISELGIMSPYDGLLPALHQATTETNTNCKLDSEKQTSLKFQSNYKNYTLKPQQNGLHFAGDFLKCIFLWEFFLYMDPNFNGNSS